MKTYNVLDKSLSHISQGDQVFTVEGGVVELPVEVAADLVAAGQLELASAVESKPASKPAAKKGKKTDEETVPEPASEPAGSDQ